MDHKTPPVPPGTTPGSPSESQKKLRLAELLARSMEDESVIDNTVDATTGTIKLKATLENKNRLLWPGQFVDVSITLGTARNVVVVPGEAVQPGQRGQNVYVVKPDQTVELRSVSVGITRGNQTVIEKGVAAGEVVVIDGQLRLFPGATIRAVPAGQIDSQSLN